MADLSSRLEAAKADLARHIASLESELQRLRREYLVLDSTDAQGFRKAMDASDS